jgi:T5SS/PEP-CTERM-associated repeat protein/autotransporter-associated beta strand protein
MALGWLAASPSEAAITLTDDVIPSPPAGDPWDVFGTLSVGETLNGTMTINAGSDVTNTDGFVANLAGSTGSVTVHGVGSTWNNSGNLRMGNGGNGTLNITGGGTVTVTGADHHGRLGNLVGGTGTATVDGAGSTWTSDNFILVGREGTGTLNIQNGGVASDSVGGLAIFPGSTGAATIDGPGSMWTNVNELQVGTGGTATLNILNGGVASSPLGYIASIADPIGSGTVTISGLGSAWNNSNQLQVGYAGNGTLHINSGATASDSFGVLGTLVDSTGTATVSGTGSSWTNSSELWVGYEGAGALNILGGAAVSAGIGIIGNQLAGNGTATVDGVGSTWTNSGSLTVGSLGTGTLHIEHGGSVSATALDGVGGVNFDGGSLRIMATDAASNTLTLNAGGGTLDVSTADTTVTVTSNIGGTGGLTKVGAGTLELTGANTYASDTRIDAGTLHISQAFLSNLADAYLASGTSFGLNFSGTDLIDSLFIDGFSKPVGTYGAIGSPAQFPMALFSGTGLLRVSTIGVLGDYNDDGIVNAADYTVWRDRLGSATSLPNDDTAGVGPDDYDRWKASFGQTPGAGSSALNSAAIPEPTTMVLLTLAATASSSAASLYCIARARCSFAGETIQ